MTAQGFKGFRLAVRSGVNADSPAKQDAVTTIVVMGVAGAGKTTVGRALAERLGWRFVDADDLHPAANVEKMSSGIPLTAEDRAPWLDAIVRVLNSPPQNSVLACSALTRAIRKRLEGSGGRVRFVYLRVPEKVLRRRLLSRTGHFFPPSLLRSQLDMLEEPENAIVVDTTKPGTASISEIIARLTAR